jgi:quercetin dioxygenase-like cupin family protein
MGAGAAGAAEGRSDRRVIGRPAKDGLYVLRLKIPANYKIPAHNHPTTEYVTIISGKFYIGMGDKLDEKKGVELRAGGFGAARTPWSKYTVKALFR